MDVIADYQGGVLRFFVQPGQLTDDQWMEIYSVILHYFSVKNKTEME